MPRILFAAGLDVLTISRRPGHGPVAMTLNTDAHLFLRFKWPCSSCYGSNVLTGAHGT